MSWIMNSSLLCFSCQVHKNLQGWRVIVRVDRINHYSITGRFQSLLLIFYVAFTKKFPHYLNKYLVHLDTTLVEYYYLADVEVLRKFLFVFYRLIYCGNLMTPTINLLSSYNNLFKYIFLKQQNKCRLPC